MRGLTALFVGFGLIGIGCSSTAEEEAMDGEAYYVGAASMALGATNNQADCALCHSDDGEQSGYSGSSLQDIAYRRTFKGGGAATLRDAVNACVTGWMGGEALEEDAPAWLALEAFLQRISTPDVTEPLPLEPEVLEDEAAYEQAYAGGDAAAGEQKYLAYCAACHDEGLIVGAVAAWDGAALAQRSAGRIAQKVRTSGPPPSGQNDPSDVTPGPMPFFEPADLSADDLRDIIAHIKAQ